MSHDRPTQIKIEPGTARYSAEKTLHVLYFWKAGASTISNLIRKGHKKCPKKCNLKSVPKRVPKMDECGIHIVDECVCCWKYPRCYMHFWCQLFWFEPLESWGVHHCKKSSQPPESQVYFVHICPFNHHSKPPDVCYSVGDPWCALWADPGRCGTEWGSSTEMGASHGNHVTFCLTLKSFIFGSNKNIWDKDVRDRAIWRRKGNKRNWRLELLLCCLCSCSTNLLEFLVGDQSVFLALLHQ